MPNRPPTWLAVAALVLGGSACALPRGLAQQPQPQQQPQTQQPQPRLFPEYYTQYGVLRFDSRADTVMGVYPHEDGRIQGVLSGHELRGTWRQRQGGGRIVMTFSPGFERFTAAYNHDSSPNDWRSDWAGVVRPSVVQRLYETEWGTLDCVFEETQVACTYPWFNGRVLGQLRDGRLVGMWQQANGSVGALQLEFAHDWTSFEGTYNDYNIHPDQWNSWRGELLGGRPVDERR